MLKSLSLRSKLLIPVFSLIVILLFLGSIIIVSNYYKIESLNNLDEKIAFSNIRLNEKYGGLNNHFFL